MKYITEIILMQVEIDQTETVPSGKGFIRRNYITFTCITRLQPISAKPQEIFAKRR